MADGIVFKTTDMLRWGAGGGAGTAGNLTPLQFDENMWELLTRIQALENDPPVAVSISNFTVIGSQFEVNMSDGSTLGPYDLPVAAFRFRGDWINAMPLLQLDLVSVPERGLYMTLIAHTTPVAPAEFDPDAVDETPGSPTEGDPLYQQLFGEDTYIYDLGFFFPGKPGIGVDVDAAIAGHVFAHAVTAPIDLVGSYGTLKIAGAADLSFPIEHDGVEVGSIDFAAGETVATFTFAAEVEIAAGEVITVIRPAAIDADARELSVTLKMSRVF
jgi:hypothetical protein